MRESLYEVLLIENKEKVSDLIKLESDNLIKLESNERVLDEIVIDDKSYAVATPGSEFSVKVNIYRNKLNKFPYPYIRIGLYCDGYDCNYWKRLDLSNDKDLPNVVSARFYGFKRDCDDIRAFVFSTPETLINNDNDNNNNSIRTRIGEIKIIIHEATVSGGLFNNKQSLSNEIPSSAKSINGDTKFWKQASLTTTAGRRLDSNQEKFPEVVKWSNVSTIPQHTILLNYHTEEMLELMQRIQMHESSSSKRKRESETIDLTNDDDENNNDNNNENNNDNNNNDDENQDNDDYFEAITVDKEIDVLDITDESDPQWSTVTITRG